MKRPETLARRRLILALATIACLPVSGRTQDGGYKEYTTATARKTLLTMVATRDQVTVWWFDTNADSSIASPRSALAHSDSGVTIGGAPLFLPGGLVTLGRIVPYDEITDLSLALSGDTTSVTLFTSPTPPSPTARRRNRISFAAPLVVDSGDFARGHVMTIRPNITVRGEVNKDVVTLFGDILVARSAVIRGNVVSLFGRVTIEPKATIYGKAVQGKGRRQLPRHLLRRHDRDLNLDGRIVYNRVDGLALHMGLRFDDRDTVLPSFWAIPGYAFASKRWRFGVGMEQNLFRARGLTVGGEYFRQLQSQDTLLLPAWENTLFALLATEDFMDYYEAEGGTIYARIRPAPWLRGEIRYSAYDTKWLRSHRNLWSLFGGSKRFPENFGSLDDPGRGEFESLVDSTADASVQISLGFDNRHQEEPLRHSGWALGGTLEIGATGLGGDYDYRHYRLEAIRYQRVNSAQTLLLRGQFGSADETIPPYKAFFLGGLGTLHGYHHKELAGDRFWLFAAENLVEIDPTELAVSVFWEIGQIAVGSFDRASDVKNSIGAGLYLGESFRISVAQRLDRGFDNSARIHVRLRRSF